MPVSTTASPVTQVADVAMKKASINFIGRPSADAGPRDNRNVPRIMMMPKPNDSVFAGVSGLDFLFLLVLLRRLDNDYSPLT
ncbi:hypothetical protein D3C76_1682700 [compost metagenome]